MGGGGGGGGGGASLRSADGHTSASTEAVVSLVVNQPYFVGNTSAPLHRSQECYDVDDVKNATAKTSFRYAICESKYDRLHRVSPTNTAGSQD